MSMVEPAIGRRETDAFVCDISNGDMFFYTVASGEDTLTLFLFYTFAYGIWEYSYDCVCDWRSCMHAVACMLHACSCIKYIQ